MLRIFECNRDGSIVICRAGNDVIYVLKPVEVAGIEYLGTENSM